MINKNFVTTSMLVITLVFGIQPAAFADCFDFPFAAVNDKTPLPKIIVTGREAIGEYNVTDNSGLHMELSDLSNLPFGALVNRGTGYCSNPIILNPETQSGSFCIYQFTIPAQNATGTLTGQIREYVYGAGVTILSSPFNVRVVSTPQSGMPYLTLSNADFHIPPGMTQNVTVTNTSPDTAANNVQFIIQDSHVGAEVEVVESSGCISIPPNGGTCSIDITAKPSATPDPNHVPILVQGSNTYTKSATLVVLDESKVVAPDTTIGHTGNTYLTLINASSYNPATINSVAFTNGTGTIHGVTINSSSCTSIPSHGGTCSITLTAVPGAYGSDDIEIRYTLQSGVPVIDPAKARVTVANTSLKLCDKDGIEIAGNKIEVSEELSPQTFKFKNAGNFSWQNSLISLGALTGVSITTNGCSGTVVTPGSYCSFALTTTSAATPGGSAVLSATGSNISQFDNSVIVSGDLAIFPDTDSADLHLGYRAIKILNAYSESATLKSIALSSTDPIASKIKYCSPTDTACVYKTDSKCVVDTSDRILAAGESCKIWFKALDNDAAGLGSVSGSSGVTVVSTWPPPYDSTPYTQVENFNFTYNQDLYVGGLFTVAAATPASYIAKWNGTGWSALSSGMNSDVNAIANVNGDLYVGGIFTSAGGTTANRIARWNGVDWSSLGSGLNNGVNNRVSALGSWNNNLYVGGLFTVAGNGTVVNYITKWDGTSWSSLYNGVTSITGGQGVSAIACVDNFLYVAGDFNYANNSGATLNVNHIAKWDGSTWYDLNSGTQGGGYILALNAMDNNHIYAGGYFESTMVDPVLVNHVAKWSDIVPVGWSALCEGLSDCGVDGTVSALASVGDNIYVGGIFDKAGSRLDANNIAKWNSAASGWSLLGVGLNGKVSSLVNINGNLYAGGLFNKLGDDTTLVNYIAKWNSSAWSPLIVGSTNIGVNGAVNAFAVAPSLVITH